MELLLSLGKTNGDWVVTVARVVLGVILFVHGAQNLLGWFGGPRQSSRCDSRGATRATVQEPRPAGNLPATRKATC
jgi:uncharacterized membrane protein YphA (DoxX/SURF4 family)